MAVEILTGDCRAVLPTVEHADVVITDPVWPNFPEGLLEGRDRPVGLLAEAIKVLPASVKRLVIVLRSDCDPPFPMCRAPRWPFFNAH